MLTARYLFRKNESTIVQYNFRCWRMEIHCNDDDDEAVNLQV